MKIRLQLSRFSGRNRSWLLIPVLSLVVLLCLYVLSVIPIIPVIPLTLKSWHKVDIVTTYHQSQWNDFAPEIDRSLRESVSSVESLKIDHVYGGVVSHHIPTTIPKLVEFYSRLKAKQDVRNFIIIGPDHTDAGAGDISVSAGSFFTKYGELKPITSLATRLAASNLVTIDERPFDPEHSIGAQALVISAIFPGAHITPIILRHDTSHARAQQLGNAIANELDNDTVLIASVDFSHYLTTDRAMSIDKTSGQVLRDLDLDSISLVKADSSKSIEAFMVAMKAKGAVDTEDIEVINTDSFMQNSDYTTGYVFGYWGRN